MNPSNHHQQHQQQYNHEPSLGQQHQDQIFIKTTNLQEQLYSATTMLHQHQQQQQPIFNQFFAQQNPLDFPLTFHVTSGMAPMFAQSAQQFNEHLQATPETSTPIEIKRIPPWKMNHSKACFAMSSSLKDERCAETPAPDSILECQLGPETPSPNLPSTSPPLVDTSEILRTIFKDTEEFVTRPQSCEKSPNKRHHYRRTKAQIAADRRTELEKTLKNCRINIKLSTFHEDDLPARVFVGSKNNYEIRTKLPRVPQMKLVPSEYAKLINIGFMRTQKGIIFACITRCHFKTYDPNKFRQHLTNHKIDDEYGTSRGSCKLCNQSINDSSLLYELLHMNRSHLIPRPPSINEIMYSKIQSLSLSESDVSDNEEEESEYEQETAEETVPSKIDLGPALAQEGSGIEKPSSQEGTADLCLNDEDLGMMASAMEDLDDILTSDNVRNDDISDDSFPIDTQKIEAKLEEKDPDFDPQCEIETEDEVVPDEAVTSYEDETTDAFVSTEGCATTEEDIEIPDVPLSPVKLRQASKTHKKHKKNKKKKKKKKKLSLESPKKHKSRRKSEEKREKSEKKRRRRAILESESSDGEPLSKRSRSSESSSDRQSPSCSEESSVVAATSGLKKSSLNDSIESKSDETSNLTISTRSSKERSPIESHDSDRTNDSGIVVQHEKETPTVSKSKFTDFPTTATYEPAEPSIKPKPVSFQKENETESEQEKGARDPESQEDVDFLKRIPQSLIQKIKQKALKKDNLNKVQPPMIAVNKESSVPKLVERVSDMETETAVTLSEPKTMNSKLNPDRDPIELMWKDYNEFENNILKDRKRGRPPKTKGSRIQTARKRPGGFQILTPVKTLKSEPVENLLDQMKPCSVMILRIKNASKGKDAFVQYEIPSDEEETLDPESRTSNRLSNNEDSNSNDCSGTIDLPQVPPEAENIQDFNLSTLSDVLIDDTGDHTYSTPPKAVKDFPSVMDIEKPKDQTENDKNTEKTVEVEEDEFFEALEALPESPKEAENVLKTSSNDDENMLVETFLDSQESPIMKNLSELYPWIDDDIVEKWVKTERCAKTMLEEKYLFSNYKCMSIDCSYFTSSLSKFKDHIEQHKGEDSFFLCSFCLADEKRPEDLYKHIEEFHAFDRYQCSKCMYRCCEKFYCDIHRKKFHTNQKVSIMKSSGQVLKVNDRKAAENNLKKRLDEIVKPKKCICCSKKFHTWEKYSTHLQEESQNTNDKEKIDLICLEMKACHTKLASDVNELGMYRCVYCTDGFQEEALIREHLAIVHPQNFSFVCLRSEMIIDLETSSQSQLFKTSIIDLVNKKQDKELKVTFWKGTNDELTCKDDGKPPEVPLKPLKIVKAYSLSNQRKQ